MDAVVVPVRQACGIGASDAQKRVPEVFRRYFLERPPHPGGGYGLTPYQMFEQKIWVFSTKKISNFRIFSKKHNFSKIYKTFKFLQFKVGKEAKGKTEFAL